MPCQGDRLATEDLLMPTLTSRSPKPTTSVNIEWPEILRVTLCGSTVPAHVRPGFSREWGVAVAVASLLAIVKLARAAETAGGGGARREADAGPFTLAGEQARQR